MTERTRTIIVGGVAGGMAAATRLRRIDEDTEIVVLEAGPYVSFSNCGLPYFVGGVIENRDELLSHTPDSFRERFRIDVRIDHEVTDVDAARKTVTVREGRTGSPLSLAYDTLIIASGAAAVMPPELQSNRTFALRTIDDMDRIVALLSETDAGASVVIVGAGYIGLEAAENIRHRGFTTTLVQRGPQIFPALDVEMVAGLHEVLEEHGVTILTNTRVDRVDAQHVVLDDGSRIRAELVIDATGITPAVGVAEAAGIRIGDSGGIWVDDLHRTSDSAIYAVGDAAEKTDFVTGEPTLVALAGLANRHGRATADVIAGIPEPAVPALGTSIVGVFGVAAASTGWNESRLRAAKRPHRIIHIHPASHAGYYPGASPLAMKLLIDPDTDLILGAQVVGRDGVDKRIDVLATAMSAGLSASQLKNLELAYAPQFGSAKDPINLLGYVADNSRDAISTVQWNEIDEVSRAGATLLDVRTPDEFDAGHIPGALNIPVDELRDRAEDIPTGHVVIYCKVGQRGNVASRILANTGHTVSNLDGGYLTWRAGTTMRTAGE